MPDQLCPICKAWLCGNVKDGVFCRHCGYEKEGKKNIEQKKEKKTNG